MICTCCFRDAPDVKTKLSFLGFPSFTCPRCKWRVSYPLATKRRVFYWVLVVVIGAAVVATVMQGRTPIPGFLGVAIIWAVVEDISIQGKVRLAQRRNQELLAKADQGGSAEPIRPSLDDAPRPGPPNVMPR